MRAFLLLLAPLLLGATEPRLAKVAYTLSPELTGGALTALHVTARFRVGACGTAGFGWPSEWAGEKHLGQWAREVRFAGAIEARSDRDAHWLVHARPGAAVTVSYRVGSAFDQDPTSDHSDQAKPVIRPRWFYAVGYSVFGAPDDQDDAPATFVWTGAPRGFGFASDLQHLAGPDLRVFDVPDGSGIRVASIGHYAFAPEQLNKLAREVIEVERRFWRTDEAAPFLVTIAPTVSAPASLSYGGTGLNDAFALWVDQNTSLEQVRGLLAHEYFHTWNAERLGQAADAPQYWFSEGFTDYYARALLLRAGLITPTEWARMWNEMLLAYAQSPARASTNDTAAAAFWSDAAAEKLPYQRGAMLAAMWNAELRRKRGGASGLDEVLHMQLAAARSIKQPPTLLFTSLARQQGLDIGADVDRCLVHAGPILLPADTFGPCASVATERRASFSRGFDADATARANNVVTDVDPRSPAYAAGLRNGMRILARVEGEPENSTLPYAFKVDDAGRERVIRYLPQGRATVLIQQIRLVSTAPGCSGLLSGEAGASLAGPAPATN